MQIMAFLSKNSNSTGHLLMSILFMVFLGIVIIFVRDAATTTFAIGLMTMLFGYWFGAQSTAIKHQDATEVAQVAASTAAQVAEVAANTAAAVVAASVPATPTADTNATQKLPVMRKP